MVLCHVNAAIKSFVKSERFSVNTKEAYPLTLPQTHTGTQRFLGTISYHIVTAHTLKGMPKGHDQPIKRTQAAMVCMLGKVYTKILCIG